MSDAADRRIAELEAEVRRLVRQNGVEREISSGMDAAAHRLNLRIVELEKKLVERDVYEAEQRLPPEQAALIKHLKTVDRCINDGREEVSGYDVEIRCVFCRREDTDGHDRGCHWLALQFDRKPAETMAMVEGWAWDENARRDRERARAMAPKRPWRTSLTNQPPGQIYRQPAIEELRRARLAVEESRERLMAQPYQGFNGLNVVTHPLVPPGAVYVMQPSTFVLPPEQRRSLILGEWPEGSQVVNMTHDSITVDVPVAPSLGIGGEEPAEVAPPDDEDVP